MAVVLIIPVVTWSTVPRTFDGDGLHDTSAPFETCFQLGSSSIYCWTKSYYKFPGWDFCFPDGYGGDGWHILDPKYVNPVTHPHSCGTPCQDVHQRGNKPTPAPTPAPPDAPCLPASGTFSGISYTGWQRQSYPFETCFQLGDASTYCWTKSYFCTQKHWNSSRNYCFCAPDGDKWQPISAEYVNPVTHPNSCGSPCLEIHQAGNGHTR